MDYITKNERLIKKMSEWGFKRKNINTFRRTEGEAILDFYFTHNTNNEHHVKYYCINVNIWYPEIDRIKKNGDFYFGIPNASIWCDLGHLMGFPIQREYRISDDDDESTINMVVDRMFYDLRNYALSIMKRYSVLSVFIDDYEKGLLEGYHVNKQTMALMYLMCYGKEKAIDNTRQQLYLLREKLQGKLNVTIQKEKFADMDPVLINFIREEIEELEDLYEKLKTYNANT